jgi:hypothetical protein
MTLVRRVRARDMLTTLAGTAFAWVLPVTTSWALATSFAPSIAAAGLTESRSMQVHVEVELDIFSGMPNPAWVLDDDQAARFQTLLSAASKASRGELAGNLGYRGFIVTLKQGVTVQSVRVQNGTVHVFNGGTALRFKDEDRQLEQWLLNAAKPHVDRELFETIRREF